MTDETGDPGDPVKPARGSGLRLDVDASPGRVQGNRGTAAADRAVQMIAVDGPDRADGQIGGYAAAARRGIDRCARALREQQGDAASGGSKVDAIIAPQFRTYAASGSMSIDFAVVVLDVDAAAGGSEVEIARRIRNTYAAAGGAEIGRAVEPLRLDAAPGGMNVYRTRDILDANAAA